MTTFLPESGAQKRKNGWAGWYRRFVDDKPMFVRDGDSDRIYPSEAAAKEAARERLITLLNPPIRKSEAPADGGDLVMKAQEARLQKQADAWRKAFGAVRAKNKSVKVEEVGRAKAIRGRS